MRLQTRLTLTSLAVLGMFLSVSGVLLTQAFNANIRASADAQMRLVVYGLLGSAMATGAGISFPAHLPEPRLDQSGSGLYARLLDETGRVVWISPSAQDMEIDASRQPLPAAPGSFVFEDGGSMLELLYGFIWEADVDRGYTLHVLSDAQPFRLREEAFRDALVAGLGISALLFLGVQFLLLVQGLAPIRRMSESIDAIESGRVQRLGENYPSDLLPLAKRLDVYIGHERELQRRYKSAVDDLAHSLKTPLSVLAAELESSPLAENGAVQSALTQMRDLIRERLGRVRVKPVLGRRCRLSPVLDRLGHVMVRLYPGKGYANEVGAGFALAMTESDLMELFGSLLENAFRLAGSQVRVVSENKRDEALDIVVHDDGPGIAEADRQGVLVRGARADTMHTGEGLGLAIAADIVSAYGGGLEIGTSHLGGAAIRLRFKGASG